MILNKFLNVTLFSRHNQPKPMNTHPPRAFSSVLRIVHPGGKVECYYMATPAVRILDKYPSHVLAKPEVFRRPWDSVVRPEKMLTPGHKFLLVPIHTVRKLRRKIKKPPTSYKDRSSCAMSGEGNSVGGGSMVGKEFRVKKHVTFVGVDNKKKMKSDGKDCRRRQNALVTWQPSLNSVTA